MISVLLLTNGIQSSNSVPWAVVGAGPAGIVSIAVLLENGVLPKDISWIDAEFKVGRLGKYYSTVSSNHMVCGFTQFLNSSPIFQQIESSAINTVKEFDQDKESRLKIITDALQDITYFFSKEITTHCKELKNLTTKDTLWHLDLGDEVIAAQKVILAIGSHPKTMSLDAIEEIPLDLALNQTTFTTLINPDDSILVIGSAHSALHILRYLSNMPVKRVVNLYNALPSYGLGGLQGSTALWAQQILEKNPPANLERIPFSLEAVEHYKKECNKVVYAFGFEHNTMHINGSTKINFDSATGVIAPNLYGIGIAFPEQFILPNGRTIHLVGVNSFMRYAKKMIPHWIANENLKLQHYCIDISDAIIY